MDDAAPAPQVRLIPRAATVLLVVGLFAAVAVGAVQAHLDHFSALSGILAVAAVASGAVVVYAHGRASISASFLVVLLAAAFLGPATACLCALLAELTAARRLDTPRYAVAFNTLGVLVPSLAAANLIRVAGATPTDTPRFYLMVAAAGVVYQLLNFAIVAIYQQLY